MNLRDQSEVNQEEKIIDNSLDVFVVEPGHSVLVAAPDNWDF